ncbi:pancreatic triacylglycerol lipase-like [Topomyia yanbarensis]|uniref:pancreatic triacylglycerol lipase-like n=1 Tax=Topomyia yanbarensis TaxID=2498891 RepID=UPI00273C0B07|nr:pancreatic triacylglycerol lipase-like [Topomyia yanbarensis]
MVRNVLLTVLLYTSWHLTSGNPLHQARWELIPDGNGFLRMVNIAAYSLPEDDSVQPLFNPHEDIIYRLFTRSNPTEPQILTDAESIQGSYFNPDHPTRFTIHGWSNDGSHFMNQEIRDEFWRVGDFNIITVDWGVGAMTNYISARANVGPAGAGVSGFLDRLLDATGISPDSIYLIGFSLGAHVAGNAGKGQRGLVNTIIALDPAGPLFSVGQETAVSPTDGQYVETIMTNAGLLGINTVLGQANFFPNWGRTQPGCGTDTGGSCAHSRAPQFYAESISSSTAFRAVRCANHEEMLEGICTPSGDDANMGGQPSNQGRGVSGVFHLSTRAEAPFALG